MKRICKYCGETFDGEPAANACPECVETRKHNVMRDRTCKACGAEFIGGPRAWYCPTCRGERQKETDRRHKQRKAAGKTRLLGSIDYCTACGKQYVVNGPLQRYCPECSPEETRKNANRLSREWNEQNVTPEGRKTERNAHAAEIQCVICGKVFIPKDSSITCSSECSVALQRKNATAWEKAHREERNAYRRNMRENMTDEQKAEYRKRKNQYARELYAKNRKQPICSVCGKPIPDGFNARRFCSDECRNVRKREQWKAQNGKRRNKQKLTTDMSPEIIDKHD